MQRRRAAQTAHAHLPLAAVAEAEAAGLPIPFATTLRVQTYPAGKDEGGLSFAGADERTRLRIAEKLHSLDLMWLNQMWTAPPSTTG